MVGGAGRGSAITSVVSMAPHGGRLYVGASGWLNSVFPASELIRVAPDGRWEVVVGNPRHDADGVLRSPLSGLPDGFGNPFNHHFWRMQSFRGALLLGTNDWSWSLRGAPGVPDQLRSEFGFDLYGTCDGSHWWVATRDGFGRDDDFGVRTMAATRAGLFIGTTNHVRGTSIYRSRARPCAGAATRVRPRARPAYSLPRDARTALERERARAEFLSTADGKRDAAMTVTGPCNERADVPRAPCCRDSAHRPGGSRGRARARRRGGVEDRRARGVQELLGGDDDGHLSARRRALTERGGSASGATGCAAPSRAAACAARFAPARLRVAIATSRGAQADWAPGAYRSAEEARTICAPPPSS